MKTLSEKNSTDKLLMEELEYKFGLNPTDKGYSPLTKQDLIFHNLKVMHEKKQKAKKFNFVVEDD